MSDTSGIREDAEAGMGRSPSLKSMSLIVGILLGIVSLAGAAGGYFDNRIDTVEHELRGHKENSTIHRTAEEGRAIERADADFKQFVRERLISIENRIDNMERRQ